MSERPAALEPALHARAGRTCDALVAELHDLRNPDGTWTGRLASSALSTATAMAALARVDPAAHTDAIAHAIDWLVATQAQNGGWGDTPDSPPNLATTLIAFSALSLAGADHHPATTRASGWIARAAGDTSPAAIAAAVRARYGKDQTFAVPILFTAALAGKLGPDREAWAHVPPLPLELGTLPHRLLRWAHLPVVSYALPALIAIGAARWHFRRPGNPLTRLFRAVALRPALRRLAMIQPESGGFLEAAPLTSFVTLALAATGRSDHPVVPKAVTFLQETRRADGSWPIDTDLATWGTTLAMQALPVDPTEGTWQNVRRWLLDQQHLVEHPYTGAAPGGWAWTDLSGGVPDADDTAGALLALRRLGVDDDTRRAAAAGVRWLLDLQNADGGIPTFCRGWGRLPFDRSSADLTAHALRAWHAWRDDLPAALARRVDRATARARTYLARQQRPDGSWVPLWFGHQHAPDEANPVFGTARVVRALAEVTTPGDCLHRGVAFLLAAQGEEGGFGPTAGLEPSVEETAVACEALASLPAAGQPGSNVAAAVAAATRWLCEATSDGTAVPPPTPIGLYFARLWYHEHLYPRVFAAAALRTVLGR